MAASALDGTDHRSWVAGTDVYGRPVAPATRFPLYCLSKVLTGVAVGQLVDMGTCALDDTLGDLLPDLAGNGKAPITLGELLTNSAGIDESGLPGCRDGLPRDRYLDLLAAAPRIRGWLERPRARYDYEASHNLLGLLVERHHGGDYRHLVRERVAEPLGTSIAVPEPAERVHDHVGDRPTTWTPYAALANGTVAVPSFYTPLSSMTAAAAVGTADDLRHLFTALHQRATAGAGPLPVSPAWAAAMIRDHRGPRHDEQIGVTAGYGLAVMTGLRDYRPWGLPTELGASAYGHLGLGSVFAGVDPDRDLVFAVISTAMSSKPQEFAVLRGVLGALLPGGDTP